MQKKRKEERAQERRQIEQDKLDDALAKQQEEGEKILAEAKKYMFQSQEREKPVQESPKQNINREESEEEDTPTAIWRKKVAERRAEVQRFTQEWTEQRNEWKQPKSGGKNKQKKGGAEALNQKKITTTSRSAAKTAVEQTSTNDKDKETFATNPSTAEVTTIREESPISFINSFLITAQREKQLHTEEPPNNTTDNKQLTPIQVIGKPSSIAPEYPEINDNNMDDAWKVTHVLKWKTDKKLGNLVYIRWNDRSEGWYDQKIPELNEWGKEIEKIMNSQKPVNDVRKKGKKGRTVK